MSSVPSHLFLALEGVVPSSTTFYKEISLLGITLSFSVDEVITNKEEGGSLFSKVDNKEETKKITFKITFLNKETVKTFIIDDKKKSLINFFFSFINKVKNTINVTYRNIIKRKDIIRIIKKG